LIIIKYLDEIFCFYFSESRVYPKFNNRFLNTQKEYFSFL
jgi:hypothetical protein